MRLPSKFQRQIMLAALTGLTAARLLADPAAARDQLVAANNGFAFELMNQVVQAQPDGNVFLSPYSVASALLMVNNGAAGVTRAEMEQVLKISRLPAESVNPAFADLSRQLAARPDLTLTLANGLWIQQGFHLKPEFVDANRKFFQAETANVDFAGAPAAAAINDWAEQHTQGRIKNVVQFPFPPLTRLILANAIYFKGQWVRPFKPNLTAPRDFHLAGGQAKSTPMMVQDGRFEYQATTGFQAVKLPYRGGLEMELLLPDAPSSPQKLLADMAARGTWADLQNGFAPRQGRVTLPKFKVEYATMLNQPLEALGMKSAFADNADFSDLADQPVRISQVKQKSYVNVNEEGTEAAAVTTVTITALAIMRPPPDTFTMVLDRPFLFVIADAGTGSILFMGVVNEP